MIELDDAKTLFSFDKDLEPVLKVPSGETVRIRTKDCFGNQLQGPEDQLSEIDWEADQPRHGPDLCRRRCCGRHAEGSYRQYRARRADELLHRKRRGCLRRPLQ